MKKNGIINQPLSAVIAGMGHTDTLAVADAGLPIPPGIKRIDLALKAGTPSLVDTLRVVLSELEVERITLASEIVEANPAVYAAITEMLPHASVELILHEEFKRMTAFSRAIVRTGEFSPYANVILHAGVIF